MNTTAIHAEGNGDALAYLRGCNLTHFYGPIFTSPNLVSTTWVDPVSGAPIAADSHRLRDNNVWEHTLVGGRQVGRVVETVSPRLPAWTAWVELAAVVDIVVVSPCGTVEGWEAEPRSYGLQLVAEAPTGAELLGHPVETSHAISMFVVGDGVPTHSMGDSSDTFTLSLGPGRWQLVFAAGTTVASALDAATQAAPLSADQMIAERAAYDEPVVSAVAQTTATWGHNLRGVAGDAALMIASQCSADGGIQAGSPYPFAYSRDQYGTCRGLLTLGLHELVRNNISYRWHKWQRFGNLMNAESMGNDLTRHVHENDEVEATAYTILQVLDYAEATGDTEPVHGVWPMLEWCFRAQERHLGRGMLPFNGDETYVAGGMFPRSNLLDGSFESTLLFIESGQRLLDWADQLGLAEPALAQSIATSIALARELLAENFVRDEVIYANNPQRRDFADDPEVRGGVCEACNELRGWCRRTKTGRYLCLRCVEKHLPFAPTSMWWIPSSALSPFFVGSGSITRTLQEQTVRRALHVLDEQGGLYGEGISTTRETGYDLALLLLGLTQLNHSRRDEIGDRVLALADELGMWSEYYDNGLHAGVRCRPWETAIALTALRAAELSGYAS